MNISLIIVSVGLGIVSGMLVPICVQAVDVSVTIEKGSSTPSNAKFFEPKTLTVSTGTTVLWKNGDSTLHTVTSGDPHNDKSGIEFDSLYLAPHKTFEHPFDKIGKFDYYCTLHPFMTGTITVVSASSSGASLSESSSLLPQDIQENKSSVPAVVNNTIKGTVPSLPEVLTIRESGSIGENQIPLVAVLQNGNLSLLKQENYPEKSMFELHSYNPTIKFEFSEGSKVPLVGVKQVLVGKIKSYEDREAALKSSSLFKNIGFNEDTVLLLENNGLSYIVIEAQFAKNISGIYSAAFDNSPFGTKSTYQRILQDDLKSNDWKVIESNPVKIKSNDSFLLVAQSIMCHLASEYGFRVCGDFGTFVKPSMNNTRPISEPLGYKTVYEKTTHPKTFTPEQQAAIDMQCNVFGNKYSSLSIADRGWLLANC